MPLLAAKTTSVLENLSWGHEMLSKWEKVSEGIVKLSAIKGTKKSSAEAINLASIIIS
jgi:hypothetical protein